jgi:hypothetical protein
LGLQQCFARLDEASQPDRSAKGKTENKDPVQFCVRRSRHHRAEEIQQRVMQQIEPKGCSGKPANQPFEPTSRHPERHIGEANNKKRDKGTDDEIIGRKVGRQPSAARVPKQLLAADCLERDKAG